MIVTDYSIAATNSRLSLEAGTSADIWAERPLTAADFLAVRRQTALKGYKWDAQVGDVTTLAAFPLVMKRRVWRQLAIWAEQMTAELAVAETELAQRPDLLGQLGLPSALRQVLAMQVPVTPTAGRVIRFDFHLTSAGWRISEANSDVPGGFSEASHYTSLMARYYPQLQIAGNPGETWGDFLASAAGSKGALALVSAAGYLEDHQVVSYLAERLRSRGCSAFLAKPEQIKWRDGHAYLETAWHSGPLAVVVRFYQAEWMAKLSSRTGWAHFFRGGKTSVANPPLAVLSESKRFPLVWDSLETKLPTWRALLPETRDPRDVAWVGDDHWLLKTAMCNTGDTVSSRPWMPQSLWRQIRFKVMLHPGNWIAQRRFESLPVATPNGLRHVCVGVYTVNGRAAGAYTRLSPEPLINFAAIDVPLLLEAND